MSDRTDFFGGNSNPQGIKPPKVLSGFKLYQDVDNLGIRSSNICPYPDNSGWGLEHGGSNVASFSAYNASNVLQWSVAPADISATATGWLGFLHWDTVNNKIYVCVCENATRVWVASLNPATGAITNEFDFAVSIIASTTTEQYNAFSRDGNDSGDFAITGSGYSVKVSWDGTTGSTPTITDTERRLTSEIRIAYRSANGITVSSWLANGGTREGGCYAKVLSENNPNTIELKQLEKYYGVVFQNLSTSYTVGNRICTTNLSSNANEVPNPLYYDRADFDRWLEEVFKYNGGAV